MSKYEVGQWVRVVRAVDAEPGASAEHPVGAVRQFREPDGSRLCFAPFGAFWHTLRDCCVEPWVPKPGERVRRAEGRHVPLGWAEEFVVDKTIANAFGDPLVMRAGEESGYLVPNLSPVLDARGMPVVEGGESKAAPTAPKAAEPAPQAPPSKPAHCRYDHGSGVFCQCQYERPPEPSPEVHEMRTFGGVTLDLGHPKIHPRAERVFRAFGVKDGRYLAVDHPTRDGAIAAWRGGR